jgi:hypothetical protein
MASWCCMTPMVASTFGKAGSGCGAPVRCGRLVGMSDRRECLCPEWSEGDRGKGFGGSGVCVWRAYMCLHACKCARACGELPRGCFACSSLGSSASHASLRSSMRSYACTACAAACRLLPPQEPEPSSRAHMHARAVHAYGTYTNARAHARARSRARTHIQHRTHSAQNAAAICARE